MENQIMTLKEFAALHGKSYDYARTGIAKTLIERGFAHRVGGRAGVKIDPTAPWPRRDKAGRPPKNGKNAN